MNKSKTVLTIFVTFWRERLGRDLKSKTELNVWWKERFNQMGDIVMSKVIVIIKGNFHQVGRVLKDCSVQWRVECPIVKNFCEKKKRNSSRLEIFKWLLKEKNNYEKDNGKVCLQNSWIVNSFVKSHCFEMSICFLSSCFSCVTYLSVYLFSHFSSIYLLPIFFYK